jgi:hypothetical protein
MSRDPSALANWYRRHLGWELRHLAAEAAYYLEPYYTALDEPPAASTPRVREGNFGVLNGVAGSESCVDRWQ